MAGEFEYIRWLRERTPADPRVRIGPGDDCAALAPPDRELLVTTDMLMDGTDFLLDEVGPRRVGRKAMNANLSDIAAMAGVPTAASRCRAAAATSRKSCTSGCARPRTRSAWPSSAATRTAGTGSW
jgi:thiamine monophosphate kinase